MGADRSCGCATCVRDRAWIADMESAGSPIARVAQEMLDAVNRRSPDHGIACASDDDASWSCAYEEPSSEEDDFDAWGEEPREYTPKTNAVGWNTVVVYNGVRCSAAMADPNTQYGFCGDCGKLLPYNVPPWTKTTRMTCFAQHRGCGRRAIDVCSVCCDPDRIERWRQEDWGSACASRDPRRPPPPPRSDLKIVVHMAAMQTTHTRRHKP